MNFPTLFKRNKKEGLQQWQIFVNGNTFYTIDGQVGGKLTTSAPTICEPTNVGKKNETTAEQQALKEATARHAKKLKSNYFEDSSKVDNLTFFEPALCKDMKHYKHQIDFSSPFAVEVKLNGIRCIITKDGAHSRTGEKFHCLDHVLEELQTIFEANPDAHIDGELYNETLKNDLCELAEIVSVNRKLKDITPAVLVRSREIVQFHVYDGFGFEDKKAKTIVTKKSSYVVRKAGIQNLLTGLSFCFYHPYKLCTGLTSIDAELQKQKEAKGEGIVVKYPNAGYTQGKSKAFLKYKLWIDEEFVVVGFEEGTGEWAGCAKSVICKLNKPSTRGDETCSSNIEGKMEVLRELWKNQEAAIGKKCTVRFQEYTPYGVPYIPYTKLPFRDYESKDE